MEICAKEFEFVAFNRRPRQLGNVMARFWLLRDSASVRASCPPSAFNIWPFRRAIASINRFYH
jgi:hypothetical protein